MSKRKVHTLTSILIILILSFVSYLIIGFGGYAANLIVMVTTLGVALVVGALLLVLRFFNLIKHPKHFLYNYFGTLNIILALFEIGVIVTQKRFYLFNIPFFHIVIGFVIIYDIYKRRKADIVINNETI